MPSQTHPPDLTLQTQTIRETWSLRYSPDSALLAIAMMKLRTLPSAWVLLRLLFLNILLTQDSTFILWWQSLLSLQTQRRSKTPTWCFPRYLKMAPSRKLWFRAPLQQLISLFSVATPPQPDSTSKVSNFLFFSPFLNSF